VIPGTGDTHFYPYTVMTEQKPHKWYFYLATRVAWLFILFLGKIGRITLKNRHHWKRVVASGEGFLAPIWHGKMLLPIYLHRNLGVVAMVSEHQDGEMIAQTVHRLGYVTVRGSSTRGGRQAFRGMMAALRQKKICAILPDGPKGPCHEFKMGALLLAMRANCYLLPMTFAASRPIVLKSWDRFTLWWPFSRLCLIYGEPFKVPADLKTEELETFRQHVQQRLEALEREADALFSA